MCIAMVRHIQTNQSKKINLGQSFNTFLEDYDSQPIWVTIIRIGAEIADEEWAMIPPDLSKNIDSQSSE